MTVHQPTSATELADLIAAANRDGAVLEARGGGSKAGNGGWRGGYDLIDMRSMSGVIDYDPPELVLTAWAGTPLREVQAMVAERGQMLAFEPVDDSGAATLGGTIAANVSGPRRLSHGAARDHLLGFEAVTGAGDLFKAGGKVVKNVTGFDLSKLMCGSWGALAVMTQVTLKVLPAPRDSATLVIEGLTPSQAARAMAAALRAPAEVSGAAHMQGLTALRLEGFGPSIAARAALLRDVLAPFGAAGLLGRADSEVLWLTVGRAGGLQQTGSLWRLSVPPASGGLLCEALQATGWTCALDWTGALVWALGPAGQAEAVRALAAAHQAHAVLVRASEGDDPAIAFPPEPAPIAALTGRIKAAFDPNGVLADRRRQGAV